MGARRPFPASPAPTSLPAVPLWAHPASGLWVPSLFLHVPPVSPPVLPSAKKSLKTPPSNNATNPALGPHLHRVVASFRVCALGGSLLPASLSVSFSSFLMPPVPSLKLSSVRSPLVCILLNPMDSVRSVSFLASVSHWTMLVFSQSPPALPVNPTHPCLLSSLSVRSLSISPRLVLCSLLCSRPTAPSDALRVARDGQYHLYTDECPAQTSPLSSRTLYSIQLSTKQLHVYLTNTHCAAGAACSARRFTAPPGTENRRAQN